ncbi:SHOCT domain-containing protein [Oscillibacter valericigenes]|nr:SHOCT domain-containing protein [Oscillibacter valericigenes]
MADTIARFHMEKQEFERREAMQGLYRCMDETNEERRERERNNDLYRPRFDVPAPIKEFRIELMLDHPYWRSFDEKISAPEFDRDYPRAEDYLKTYREQTEELHRLASKLMRMIDPNAGETRTGGAAQSVPMAQSAAASADAVSEIQKYKALLDAGVLTEEEFSAKKRQLLGI